MNYRIAQFLNVPLYKAQIRVLLVILFILKMSNPISLVTTEFQIPSISIY